MGIGTPPEKFLPTPLYSGLPGKRAAGYHGYRYSWYMCGIL